LKPALQNFSFVQTFSLAFYAQDFVLNKTITTEFDGSLNCNFVKNSNQSTAFLFDWESNNDKTKSILIINFKCEDASGTEFPYDGETVNLDMIGFEGIRNVTTGVTSIYIDNLIFLSYNPI